MKMPVYIQTCASKYIGEVEVESKEDFETAAYDLWEKKENDYPTLCHHCSSGMDIGDWDIDLTDIE